MLYALTLSANPFFGQVKIASTGVAQQLPTIGLNNGVILSAKSTNAASIVVGGSTITNVTDGTGVGGILEKGQSISCAIFDLSTIYIIGTAGDILSYFGS